MMLAENPHETAEQRQKAMRKMPACGFTVEQLMTIMHAEPWSIMGAGAINNLWLMTTVSTVHKCICKGNS